MRRLLAVVLLGVAACSGHTQTKADQARSIAEKAGLAPDVASFFALAASGGEATYRSTLSTKDASGQPVQITTTQRRPDVRFDTFHADGTIDSTISTGGRSYQCTMAANHWDCGELGTSVAAQLSSGAIFGASAVTNALGQFEQRAQDYDFRVEDRQLVGITARCLVTTRKPGHEQDPSLGASATMCLAPEGAVVLVDVPAGTITATAYTTTIPSDAFALPAPPASTTSTTAN